MSDTKDFEQLQLRVYGALMEARHKKDDLLEILDETMDGISDDFVIIFHGKPSSWTDYIQSLESTTKRDEE